MGAARSRGVAPQTAPTAADLPSPSPARVRVRRWIVDHVVVIVSLLVVVYLFVPVAYTFVFSFNDYRRSNLAWNSRSGPTLEHWADPCGAPGVCESFVTSLQVGAVTTLVAIVLGTGIAIALVRYRFTGRGVLTVLVFLPLATPEVVLGAGLLTIFVQGFARIGMELGFTTVVLAHVVFCLSFVVVIVRSRLAHIDPSLEEAAMDLFAGPVETFRRVTLPLLLPGIAGGALLSFSLSFDDVVVTNFVAGDLMTFPRFVQVSYLRGIPAQANVIGFAMFALTVVLVFVGQALLRRRDGCTRPARAAAASGVGSPP